MCLGGSGRLRFLLAELQLRLSFLIENQYIAMVSLLRRPAFRIAVGGGGGPAIKQMLGLITVQPSEHLGFKNYSALNQLEAI